MAGLCTPLPTLRRHPHGCLRTARGRRGSLLLHRSGLPPPTPCRSPGAPTVMLGPASEMGIYRGEQSAYTELLDPRTHYRIVREPCWSGKADISPLRFRLLLALAHRANGLFLEYGAGHRRPPGRHVTWETACTWIEGTFPQVARYEFNLSGSRLPRQRHELERGYCCFARHPRRSKRFARTTVGT
jgi:hypothetical protein